MKKLLAFTLAETLIVIGIIGVVSALTLPNLNSSTGEKEKVAKVKKIYRDLNDAFGRAVAVYGPVDEWPANSQKPDSNDSSDSTLLGQRLGEFMKVSKTCKYGNTTCFGNTITMGKSDGTLAYTNGYTVVLADGTSINFNEIPLNNCNEAQSASITDVCESVAVTDTIHAILVDIDGKQKGQNTLGEDVFPFVVAKSGIYPVFNDETDILAAGGSMDACTKYGICTGWVINNGNMDYKKCSVSWSGKKSCK